MDVKQQLTIEELIESFKLSHPKSISIEENLSDYDKEKVRNWPSIECPFFTDEEIDQLKDYYNESSTESYHDYFDENTSTILNSNPLLSPSHNKISYSQRVIQLQDKMYSTINPEEIDAIKQNLVDIGWNPEIKYTPESQAMARERFINLTTQRLPKIDMVDIQPLIERVESIDYMNESNTERLYPVSIILIQEDSFISGPISSFTNSDFTHSALALDGNFDRLYSFNFFNNIKFGGGFSLENMKNFPKENRLGIYSFFVKKEDYDKISNKLQEYLLNIKNTTYSLAGLLLFPFDKIKFNVSNSMICSQFVDYIMKMTNSDITNIDSSKVSPAKLYNSSVNNARIYKTYDGKVKDFDSKKAKKLLDKLSRTAKTVNENTINNYIAPVVVEARKANIEVRDNGDVLLTNPFVDFDAEYMASHKLLMQYYKSNNIEAMKYELARLYYMNYILGKKLYHNKFLMNKEKNIKTRARVLNDFNKYIKVVLKAEQNFNFGEYYEQSPFYPHTVEVTGSTVNAVKDVFKYIL